MNTILTNNYNSNLRVLTDSVFEALSTPIEGTENPDVLQGTPDDDQIVALGGNDTIIGTAGSDTIDGGDGFDTVDYSSFSNKITLLPQGFFRNGNSTKSQLIKIEEIIAPVGKANTINAFSTVAGVSINADLGANTITINNIPQIGSQTFTVKNFVNVMGTLESDTLIGNAENNNLYGDRGNDILVGSGSNDFDFLNGGKGNDTLTGTDGVAKGIREQDTLLGREGTDFFILGDENGSFYQSNGDLDRALILDFSFGEKIQLGADESYNLEANNSGFKIFLTTNFRNDLIADVKTNVLLNELPKGEFTVNSGETISDIFVSA
jgi:Ca2+-binding RTX toxin-like protein